MQRKPKALLLIAIGLATGWLGRQRIEKGMAGRASGSEHTGPSIEQVQMLASLVTARVDVADVQITQISGLAGSTKACLLVKGDFLLGTDLSQGHFEQEDEKNQTVVLVLPQPKVTSPRLDHNRTRLVAMYQSGLWQITPDDGGTDAAVINRAYRDAQRYVAEACEDPTLLPRARQQAESVLGAFFQAMGWSVKIRWMS